jgi:hypothetical protein
MSAACGEHSLTMSELTRLKRTILELATLELTTMELTILDHGAAQFEVNKIRADKCHLGVT